MRVLKEDWDLLKVLRIFHTLSRRGDYGMYIWDKETSHLRLLVGQLPVALEEEGCEEILAVATSHNLDKEERGNRRNIWKDMGLKMCNRCISSYSVEVKMG